MDKTKIDWCGSIFNPVPEHDGYYASDDGRILSAKRKNPIIMKPMVSKDGHQYVFMYENGNMKKVWVHRAVLSAARGKEEKELECRHLDDNPWNNNVANLEWGTRLENTSDKIRNGGLPIGERSGSHKLTETQVLEIREKFSGDKSSTDLSEEYGISKNSILKIVNGETWKHLPLREVKRHSTRRKTPLSDEQIRIGIMALNKYAMSIKKGRKMIYCACGCGEMLETPDSKGRDRKYIRGHNSTGKHWRWNNVKN